MDRNDGPMTLKERAASVAKDDKPPGWVPFEPLALDRMSTGVLWTSSHCSSSTGQMSSHSSQHANELFAED